MHTIQAMLSEKPGRTMQALQMHIGEGRWVRCLLVADSAQDCEQAVRRIGSAAEPRSIHDVPGEVDHC